MEKYVFNTRVSHLNTEYQISLQAIDPVDISPLFNGFGTVEYRAESSKETFSLLFSIDAKTKTMSFTSGLMASMSTLCLITCGITVVAPILDCYRNNNGDWQKFKDRLDKNGNALNGGVLNCILTCMNT